MRRINQFPVLLLFVLLAFALRAFRLDWQSLWYDEAFSVYLAHFSLADITARTAADIQPPLYYYLLHFWGVLTGEREFAVRFFSLGFGVLTVPLLYATARRLFDRAAALLAALLAVLSPLYLWYSQEARMYTLITFLLLLSSYALLRACAAPRQRRWWVVLALANIAALYTHYFALVVIAFQLLYALYAAARRGRGDLGPTTIGAGLSFAACLLVFLPWTPFVVARFGQDVSYWRGPLKLDEALRHILINFTLGESVLESQAQWLALGWLAVLVMGLIAWGVRAFATRGAAGAAEPRGTAAPAFFVALYLLVPLVLLLFLFYRNPKFNARYLMIASPALLLLLAVGLGSLFALARQGKLVLRAIPAAVLVLAFGFLLVTSAYADLNAYFDPAFTKASFREVARYIDDHLAPDEAIILTSGHLFPAFNYYYRGDAPQVRLPDDPTLNTEHVLGYAAADVLNRTLADKRGVWVVLWQDEVVDPNGFVPMLLSSQGKETKLEGTSFYHVRLRHWTLQPGARFSPTPQPATPRVANFKNKVKLLGFDTPVPTPADKGASFNLYWETLDALEEDYQVSLRVRDAAGNLWGKQDRRPAGYNYPTTRWQAGDKLFGAYTVPLLPGTPAGEYSIEVTWYTASDQSGLDVLAPNGAPLGKAVKLGPIPVLPADKPAAYAALNIQHNISQPIGPFTLLGFQLGREKASPGESVPLTLFWRADSAPGKDYSLRVAFGDVASDARPLANAQFPTSRWRAGEVVRGQYAIGIPANAPPGEMRLRLVLSDNSALDLASFVVEKTDRVFVKPTIQSEQTAIFGSDYLALAGYSLSSPTLNPGDTLKLTLYWQARGKMDKPYTVFVHVLDKDNKVVAQKDAEPLNGTRPTSGWVPNEYLADSYDLAFKPDTPPGPHQIEIGWYDAKDPTFARLQVLDANGAPAGDHVILATGVIIK